MLIGLSAGCGVIIPTEPMYTTFMELLSLEASLIQKAKDIENETEID